MKIKLQFKFLAVAFLMACTAQTFSQTVIYTDDFEDGYGNWEDGGTNCSVSKNRPNPYPHPDTENDHFSLKLRRDSENFSRSKVADLSEYAGVKIDFSHLGRRLAANEKLILQYATENIDPDIGDDLTDDTVYTDVQTWEQKDIDSDILDEVYKAESVVITDSFTATTVFRFLVTTEADSNHEIYIDDITITGLLGQTVISTDDFEVEIDGSRYGGWNDGGTNCSVSKNRPNPYPHPDTENDHFSLKLRRDNENFSRSDIADLSTYASVKIDFSHLGRRLAAGEKFILQYATENIDPEIGDDLIDDTVYTDVQTWEQKDVDSDILDEVYMDESVTISGPFTATTVFRFIAMTEADSNHEVYIDDITMTGLNTLSVSDINSNEQVLSVKNYPNPFQSETNISYDLSKSEKVSIYIYNVFGQKVSTLIESAYQPAGKNVVSWNASGFANGIYIANIQINNQIVKSLKLSLID